MQAETFRVILRRRASYIEALAAARKNAAKIAEYETQISGDEAELTKGLREAKVIGAEEVATAEMLDLLHSLGR